MLTQRHMSVIRAALRFWSEEMQPYNEELMSVYSERLKTNADFPRQDDVQWLCDNFDQIKLRFALIDEKSSTVLSRRLFDSLEDAERDRQPVDSKVAAILALID